MFSYRIYNKNYNQQQRISMTDPNLPSINLFTRAPTQKRDLNTRLIKEQTTIFDVLKQSNRIQNQPYVLPVAPPVPAVSGYQNQYMQLRNKMKLEYLNTYYDTLKERPNSQPSYLSTQRAQSFKSFGGTKAQDFKRNPTSINFNYISKVPCECEQNHMYNQHHLLTKQPLQKSPYLSNHRLYIPGPADMPFNQHPININKPSLNKTAYLDGRKNHLIMNNSIHPQKSIIHHLITQNTNPGLKSDDISKFIIQSKSVNNNQSLLIEEHHKQQKSVEAQTEEQLANKSIFIINTSIKQSQIMNKKNFQKTLKDLNIKIHNLKMDLDSEDFVIDLHDLILTKDQYVDESHGILTKLQALSQGRSIGLNNKMTGSLVWPEGI